MAGWTNGAVAITPRDSAMNPTATYGALAAAVPANSYRAKLEKGDVLVGGLAHGLVPVYYTGEENVIQRVEESLQEVGTTPDPLMDADATARAFEKLRENRNSALLVINQIEYQERTMAIMAWSPLGGGRLHDASSTDPQVQRVRAVLAKLGEKWDASIDQMAYAWILRHPANCFPVLGTNKIERIVEATKAFEISGNLTTEEWYAVWVASKGHNVP
ncbi:aldo/keto reductase [Cladochytrium replicatum]|nr:aldo/keto reductase [Cladochytrium replicatum]